MFVAPNTFASALSAVVHTPVSQPPVSSGGMFGCFLPLPLIGRPLKTLLTLVRENLTERTVLEVR
jgi:hypothetical protein